MTNLHISDPALRRMVLALLAMALIACGFYTFSLLKSAIVVVLNVLTPFLAGLLLAYMLSPVVSMLQHKLRLGRIGGTLALYILVALVLFLILAIMVPTLISEILRLFQGLKNAVPRLLTQLADSPYLNLDQNLIKTIQDNITQIEIDYQKIAAFLLPGLKDMASSGFVTVEKATRSFVQGMGAVVDFFSFAVFVIIITFYFIVDWKKIRPLIEKTVPSRHKTRFFDILSKIDVAMGGFLRGQITVAALVGAMFAFGLFIIGFFGFPALRNYCILIGTAAAVAGIIPYLGAIMGVTPAVLIVLFTSGTGWKLKIITLVAVLILFALIQAIEGFVLQPRIMGKGAGLHPLVVMFALIFGAQFGIGGMIVAVPLASICRVLVLEFYWRPLLAAEAPPSSMST